MKPVATVKFSRWIPDLAELDNPGLTEAKNCLPCLGNYSEFKTLSTTGDALKKRARGAITAYDAGNNPYIIVGDETQLLQRVGSAWLDLTGPGGYNCASRDRWNFVQYGEFVVACNYSDPMQYATIGGPFQDIEGAPRARVLGVIGAFVLAGDTADNANSLPYAVRWNAIDDVTDWPIPLTQDALSKQASRERLNAGLGPVRFISGGDRSGLVFQERGISRFTYIGGNTVFQVDNFEKSRGALTLGGNVRVEELTFFYSRQGFHVTDGVGVRDIGQGVLDSYVAADFDLAYADRMTAAVDYPKTLIHWSYPGAGHTDGLPNKVVTYNWKEDRWTHTDAAIELLVSGVTLPTSLDDLDTLFASIDDVDPDLDSPVWQGGVTQIQGFDSSHKLGTFTGTALEAIIDTSEVNLNDGGRAMVTSVIPIVRGEDSNVVVSIGTRNSQAESVSYNEPRVVNPRTRRSEHRVNAVYHRARVRISGGFDRAIGVKFHAVEAGLL